MARTGISSDVYAEYLLSTFDNFTCSHLAEIMDCSHDAASDALRGHSLKPRALWDRVRRHCPLERRRRGAMILDDRVLDKNFSKKIENACRQWSGNAGKVITGVGVVNWLHYDPLTDDYLPIDYRIWDRERDGKSKHDHARDMFAKALERDFCPDWVLFDGWYATVALLKMIHRADLWFFTRVKKNRMVSLVDQQGVYQRVDALGWSDEEEDTGQMVWLRAFGWVRLFRIVRRLPDGTKRTEFHMTNQLHLQSRTTAEAVLGYGWKIEQFYRELKQLTGIERCQARKQRSQRNHIHCAIAAWLLLWERARSLGITVYEAKRRPFTDYLRERFGMPTAYRRPHPV